MRPAGDISQSLLAAVDALATPERAPTLQELVAQSGVSLDMACQTLKNLNRSGRVCIVRTRRVDYRNRPVAEYCRPMPVQAAANNESMAGVNALLQAWG